MNPICITEAQKSAYFKTFDRKRWQFLRAYTDRFKGALMKQVEPVLSELEKGISQAMSQVDIIQEKPIREAYSQLYSQVGAYYASEVFGGLKSAGGYQTKSVEDQFLVFMQSWMETEGVNLVKNVNENTKQQLREILRAGIEKELSVEEMARQIRDSGRIAGIKRARVISRTEIIRASNMGSLQGARSSNLNLAKEWIATRDGRTRIEHTQVDGVTIPTNKEFNVGGERARYPADFQLSAAQSINCRCTLAYVPAERATQMGTESDSGQYSDARNLQDAERFINDLGIQADYSNATLAQANAVNRSINSTFNKLDIDFPIKRVVFGNLDEGIRSPFAKIDGQVLRINLKKFNDKKIAESSLFQSSIKSAEKRIKRARKRIADNDFWDEAEKKLLLNKIDRYEKRIRQYKSKPYSRVTTSMEDLINHEMGHVVNNELIFNGKKYDIFDFLSPSEMQDVGFDFATSLGARLDVIAKREGLRLGEYATKNSEEYFAESFVAYMKGDTDKINKRLLKIFKKITS